MLQAHDRPRGLVLGFWVVDLWSQSLACGEFLPLTCVALTDGQKFHSTGPVL